MDKGINGFESCGLWPCNRFKIRDEEYVTLDENSDLNEPAKVSQDRLIEGQQEQTDSVICVPQSSSIDLQENTEEFTPQPSETQIKPSEKQQDQCLEENREKSSLEVEANKSIKSIRETLKYCRH